MPGSLSLGIEVGKETQENESYNGKEPMHLIPLAHARAFLLKLAVGFDNKDLLKMTTQDTSSHDPSNTGQVSAIIRYKH
jgi:hypothetical protein